MSSSGEAGETLKEHLVELEIRLRNIIIALLVASAVVSVIPARPSLFPYIPLVARVPAYIVSVVVPKQVTGIDGKVYNVTIMPSSPFESLSLLFYAALLLGFIAASPFIAREVWLFIKPALYPHEQRIVKKYAFLFFLSFLAGSFFGLYIVAPLIMRFMLSLYPYFAPEGYELIIRVSVDEAASFGIEMAIAMGLMAEIPIIVYILLAYGIIDPEMISRDTMKWILVGSLVLGAIISPDPSGIGMLIIGFSIYLPLHIAIMQGKKAYYKRRSENMSKESNISRVIDVIAEDKTIPP